jgi:hypothetical protein
MDLGTDMDTGTLRDMDMGTISDTDMGWIVLYWLSIKLVSENYKRGGGKFDFPISQLYFFGCTVTQILEPLVTIILRGSALRSSAVLGADFAGPGTLLRGLDSPGAPPSSDFGARHERLTAWAFHRPVPVAMLLLLAPWTRDIWIVSVTRTLSLSFSQQSPTKEVKSCLLYRGRPSLS